MAQHTPRHRMDHPVKPGDDEGVVDADQMPN